MNQQDTQDARQQLLHKIQREITRLQREFEELQMLREAADELRYFRQYLLAETQQFN